MAQISTVTGINTMSDTVTQLLNQFAQMHRCRRRSDRTNVLVAGNALTLDASGPGDGGLQLAAGATRSRVQVNDANGNVRAHAARSPRSPPHPRPSSGTGSTDSGGQAAAGNYTFTITAKSSGQAVDATALVARRSTA